MIDALEAMSVEILDAKKRALEKDYQAVAQETAEGKDIMSILRTHYSCDSCALNNISFLTQSEQTCSLLLGNASPNRSSWPK